MFCIFISKQRSQTSTASPGQGFHLTDKWSNKKGGQLDQVNLYSCPICSLYCSQLFCPDPDNGVHPCSHLPNHRLASFVFGWKLLHIPDFRLLRCHALSSLPLCLPHETESFVRKLFRIWTFGFSGESSCGFTIQLMKASSTMKRWFSIRLLHWVLPPCACQSMMTTGKKISPGSWINLNSYIPNVILYSLPH